MTFSRRESLCAFIGALVGSAPSLVMGRQFAGSPLTDAEMEQILLKARILETAEIGHGVTKPLKAKMQWNSTQHAAQIQVVDKELPDFFGEDNKPVPMRDSWRFNVAAYRIDRLLGLRMATVAVPRPFKGKPAAFSWWVDHVMFEEAERLKKEIQPPDPEDFNRQRDLMRVFDELIINIDRNHANLLITKSWQLALIDHSRSFNPYRGIRNKDNLTRCSRSLLSAMRGLSAAEVSKAVGKHLTAAEVNGLLARRDRIVEFFERAVREKGEEKVLFS